MYNGFLRGEGVRPQTLLTLPLPWTLIGQGVLLKRKVGIGHKRGAVGDEIVTPKFTVTGVYPIECFTNVCVMFAVDYIERFFYKNACCICTVAGLPWK